MLRYRNLLVGEAVRMKNEISGLLMEVGEPCDARRLHGRKYCHSYLDNLHDTPDSVLELLAITCGSVEMFDRLQNELPRKLEAHALLRERVALLQSIRDLGQVTALSWALEIAEPGRFGSIGRVVSYCGLCSAQRASAGKTQRGPRNRATLAVARKLVAYLWAVDRTRRPFVPQHRAEAAQEGRPLFLLKGESREGGTKDFHRRGAVSRAARRFSPIGDYAMKFAGDGCWRTFGCVHGACFETWGPKAQTESSVTVLPAKSRAGPDARTWMSGHVTG